MADPVQVRSTKSTIWRVVQVALLLVTLVLAGKAIAGQWQELGQSAKAAQLNWGWILASAALVLAVHALLIQTWRLLLAGWGSTLSFGAAIRIWTVSNLGKYLPGKVWSIGAMGMLAQREGASAISAGGAALLNALLNIGAGLGVIALAGAAELERITPWMRNAAFAGSGVFVVGVALLPRLLPPVLTRIALWRGLPPLPKHLPASTLWLVTLLHAISWIGYGLAFALFTRGVTPQIGGAPQLFIAVYAASYLWGYLMLFAPGGIGVREAVMVALLVSLGIASKADATLLALSSRLWLTVVEVLPGLVALAFLPRTAAAKPSGAR